MTSQIPALQFSLRLLAVLLGIGGMCGAFSTAAPGQEPVQQWRFEAGAVQGGKLTAAVGGLRGDVLGEYRFEQDGELQIPGGGIDPGESPLQALHREAREETGWRIADPVRIGSFRRFTYMPDYGFWARKTQLIYLARAVRQLHPPLEPGHVTYWMVPADAAHKLDVEGDRVMVRDAIRAGFI